MRNAEAYNTGGLDDFDAVGVKALDAVTLQVDLEYPDPFVLQKLSYIYNAPVHRATIEAHGDMTERYSGWTRPESFVGNGPFVLDEWKMQRHVTVKRNLHYWDRDNVQVESIVFRPIESAATEEKMFRSGQLHATGDVPNSRIPFYRAQPESPLIEAPVMSVYYYMINTRRPPLDDVRLRQALSMGHRPRCHRRGRYCRTPCCPPATMCRWGCRTTSTRRGCPLTRRPLAGCWRRRAIPMARVSRISPSLQYQREPPLGGRCGAADVEAGTEPGYRDREPGVEGLPGFRLGWT